MSISFLAASTAAKAAAPISFSSTMLSGLWTAFKWPLLVWLCWMILKMGIGPIWRAIVNATRR